MRKLTALDLFKVSKIVRKMGIKIKVVDESGVRKSQQQIGADFAINIISSLDLAQDEIVSLIAELEGMTIEEVENQSPKTLFEQISNLLAQEGVSDFLK
jgi:hypothetical protein